MIDRFVPWIAGVSLIVACAIASPKKELWVDECYALQIAADPSTSHMLTAVVSAVDGGFPPYYLLAHCVALCGGPPVLMLRIVSAVCVAAGLLIVAASVARVYPGGGGAVALVAALVGSPLIREQAMEIRFYGFYVLAAAAVVAVHALIAAGDLGRSPTRNTITVFAAHALLVAAHPFGIVYSAAALAATAMAGLPVGQTRKSTMVPILMSWLVLVALAPVIAGISDLGQPRNWTPILDLHLFMASLIGLFLGAAGMAAAEGLGVLFLAVRGAMPRRPRGDPLLVLGCVWFAVMPFTALIAAGFRLSIFVDRYFLPSVIGAGLILAWTAAWLASEAAKTRVSKAGWQVSLMAAGVAVAASPIVGAIVWNPPPVYAYLDGLVKQCLEQTVGVVEGVVVLVEDANTFLPLDTRAGDASPYRYVLDWESALRSRSPHATVQSKLMRNAAAVGYRPGRIVVLREALDNDLFVVLDSPGIDWLEGVLASNPAFEARKLGTMAATDPAPNAIWLLWRRQSADRGAK